MADVACIYDPNTEILCRLVLPETDEQLDDPAYNPAGYVQARIPMDVVKSGDRDQLAKYIPGPVIDALLKTLGLGPPAAEPDPPSAEIAAFMAMTQQYRDQLMALSDDQRMALHAARFTLDTLDVASNLLMLRDAGGIDLTPEHHDLADTMADDPVIAVAMAVSAEVAAAPSKDKRAVFDQKVAAAADAIVAAKAEVAAAAADVPIAVDAPAEAVKP